MAGPVLSNVPVKTPLFADAGGEGLVGRNWLQFFQAIVNIFGKNTQAPVNKTTVVAWLQINVGGKIYYLPLYQ